MNKGEFFGFLSPNGVGKTTTIRMLTGIISKSGGEAQVMGSPSGSIGAKQISGVVPEQSNVYMELTAWRNLMLTAELYRIPSSEAKLRAENLADEGPVALLIIFTDHDLRLVTKVYQGTQRGRI